MNQDSEYRGPLESLQPPMENLRPTEAARVALAQYAELSWIDDILDANEVPNSGSEDRDYNRRQRIQYLLDLKARVPVVEDKLRRVREIVADDVRILR